MYISDPMDKVIDELVENARKDGVISGTLRRMNELRKQYEEMQKEYQECIKRLQSDCPHKVLREFPAGDGSWGTYNGPVHRHCYVCTLSEVGPGFTLLTNSPVLTRAYDPFAENLGNLLPLGP